MTLMDALSKGHYPIPYEKTYVVKDVRDEKIVPFCLQELGEQPALEWLNTKHTLHDIIQLAGDVSACTRMYEHTMNSCVQKYIEQNGLTATEGKRIHSDKTLFWAAPYDQLRLGVKKKHIIKVTYRDGNSEYKIIPKDGYSNFYIAGSNVKVRNGNYDIMQGALPAGQGKVDTTKDFWTSITMRSSPIIVTVNDPEEKRAVKGFPETTAYWNESLFPLKLDNGWTITREHKDEVIATSQQLPDTKIVKRGFIATHSGREAVQTITQFHYIGWPDSLGPADYELLEALHEAVDRECSERDISNKYPITAHCGNGLGRSALFAISHLFHREVKERSKAGEQIDSMELHVIKTIYEFNKQRPLQLSEGVQWQALFVALRRTLLKQKGESNTVIRAFEEMIEQETIKQAAKKLESGKKKLGTQRALQAAVEKNY